MSRPKGVKDKKWQAVERVIDRVAANDREREMLRRFFRGFIRTQAPGFLKQIAQVAGEVHEQVELIDGAIRIVSLADGSISEATAALATQKVMEGSHRLATAFEARKRAAA